MTEAAAPLECKKDGLKQMQSGEWTLVLKVHPNDMPPWLLTAPMGQRLAVVVAALEEEAEKQPEKPKERKRFEEMPLSQQAALKCGDLVFQEWLSNQPDAQPYAGPPNDEWAAASIREICGVLSRSEFDTQPAAGKRWLALHTRFLSETGRVPEQR